MTITKNSLIMMIFFLTIKRSLAQSANSQQPTANSQQPTANSQQKSYLIKIILYFIIQNILQIRAVSDFFFAIRSHCKLSVGCSFFYALEVLDKAEDSKKYKKFFGLAVYDWLTMLRFGSLNQAEGNINVETRSFLYGKLKINKLK